MVSKTMLKIDLVGQALIFALVLAYVIFTPDSIYIVGMLGMLFLGFWQYFNGLIEAVFFKNKSRIKYVLAATLYIIGFVSLTMVNQGFTRAIGTDLMKAFVIIYFFGGSIAFAGWYFYQTYRDLESENEHPRSFWDYEF